jgi:hypothetical protein
MIEGDVDDDMGRSPKKGDTNRVAGGSGNSDASREERNHANVGGQPSHVFQAGLRRHLHLLIDRSIVVPSAHR